MTQLIILSAGLFTALVIAAAFYFRSVLLKFIAIAFILIVANMIYFTFDGVKGWPAEEKDDVQGILASVVVINPSDGNEGAIYISLFPSTRHRWWEYEYFRIAPKTYFVKYSNDRAAKFEEAKKAMEEGKEVKINGIPPEEIKNGNGEGSVENVEEGMLGSINSFLRKILPKAKDTYTPNDSPDIEIITPNFPKKGTGQ